MTDKQTMPQQAADLVEVESFAPQSSLLDSIISQSRVARLRPSAAAPAT